MSEEQIFQASPEAKGKAKQLRLFAVLAWVIAMAGQVFAILKLLSNDMLTWLIAAIVVILICAMTGSYLWKKANRLDPASEKDKTRFFIQNQLGAIMGVLAFLPLVILIFTNKDLDGKTKGIAGSIATVALLAAGIQGADFNPPSVEKYTEEIQAQTASMQELTGVDQVYCRQLELCIILIVTATISLIKRRVKVRSKSRLSRKDYQVYVRTVRKER